MNLLTRLIRAVLPLSAIFAFVRRAALPLVVFLVGNLGFAQQLCSTGSGVTTNPKEISIPNTGASSSFGVSAVPTCTWSVQPEFTWIHITSITNPNGGSNPGIGSAIVNFTVDANTGFLAPRGDQDFAIRINPHDGNAGFVGIEQGAAAGDFSISVSPSSVTFDPGAGLEFQVSYNSTGGFNGPITAGFSFSNPTGFSGSFSNSATRLTVSTNASTVCPGNSILTVSGQNGNVSHTAQVPLSVQGDFSLSVDQSNPSLVQGAGASASPNLIINRLQAYGNPIALSASGIPSGVSISFGSNNTSGNSSAMTITADKSTPLGTYPITITGSGGCLRHTTTFNLTVSPSWWPAIQLLLESTEG